MLKKILSKFREIKGKEKSKGSKKNSKKSKSKSKKNSDSDYDNRFQKFYHLNKKRLNKERRGNYKNKSNSGICVRCKKRVVKGIVFCKFHQSKQKEYNLAARTKKKSRLSKGRKASSKASKK